MKPKPCLTPYNALFYASPGGLSARALTEIHARLLSGQNVTIKYTRPEEYAGLEIEATWIDEVKEKTSL